MTLCSRTTTNILVSNQNLSCDTLFCNLQVTECPTSIVSFEKLRSSDADILRTFRSVVNQLEDIYLEVRYSKEIIEKRPFT